MRWNTKRFFLVCGAMALLWVFVIYSRSVDVPRSAHLKNQLENRLNKLEKEIDSQYNEITKLLDTVQRHLQTDTVPKKDTKGPGADGHEYNEDRAIAAPPRLTVLPVLVVACDRVTVKRCLDNLVKFRPNRNTFPIVVSQDCGHKATYQVIKSFVDADPSITVVQQPDLREISVPKSNVKFRGYYKIARHYRFALNHVFKTMGHEAVIIVEDDLDISPDFFEYFQGTYPLLLQDPSIWCISAWNDNGKKDVIDLEHPELLHRTDFFPGLGWILRKDTWMELEPNWPPAFFDDWLRDPANTRGRSCIRPEVSRTYSFGKRGVSLGLYFEMHLRHMQLNMDFVEFTKLNLTYLLKLNYDEWFASQVYDAELMTADDVMALPHSAGPPVRVPYLDARSFQKAAKKLGLMDDFRSGIPRTAYKGVVSCFVRGRRVYLAPNFTWTKYDPTWGVSLMDNPLPKSSARMQEPFSLMDNPLPKSSARMQEPFSDFIFIFLLFNMFFKIRVF